jgi:hypothetical protein
MTVICIATPSFRLPYFNFLYIVTNISIARQRLGKDIPARANARKNKTSIAIQRISKHSSLTTKAVFSVWSVQRGYKKVFGSTEQLLSRTWSSSGDGSPRRLRRNGKKGIILRKEDFICDLKLQRDCNNPLPGYD